MSRRSTGEGQLPGLAGHMGQLRMLNASYTSAVPGSRNGSTASWLGAESPTDRPPAPAVDVRALDYGDSVDENLICPICRVALVTPVITHCDHVFCQRCIVQAHSLNPVCPVDRLPLSLVSGTQLAPRIVQNQLDNLKVYCPNRSRGCDMTVARSLVENHVTRYCDKTLVPCPHPSCNETVIRKDVEKGCLHYDVECDYCRLHVQKAGLEHHQDQDCRCRLTRCELCEAEILRHGKDEHMKECPVAEVSCRYTAQGCKHHMSRKAMQEHAEKCEYRVVGPVGEQMAELRAELGALQEGDRLKERRIRFLENRGFPWPATSFGEGMAVMSLPEASSENAPYDSRDQYFLSLFETIESKVERLSSTLTEGEGRQSMMLFNATLQIKEQLTEFRSTLGVLGMHVRWLMNFRLQERGRVMAGSPALTGSFNSNSPDDGTGSSQQQQLPYALAPRAGDTIRENPPRL